MMRLYHREHAGRPIRVAWVLEELGEPYEITVMTREESKGEEHRVRHPLGRVPVIEDEDGFVFESAAICLHLADLQ
jgi:glutathione S-transferase